MLRDVWIPGDCETYSPSLSILSLHWASQAPLSVHQYCPAGGATNKAFQESRFGEAFSHLFSGGLGPRQTPNPQPPSVPLKVAVLNGITRSTRTHLAFLDKGAKSQGRLNFICEKPEFLPFSRLLDSRTRYPPFPVVNTLRVRQDMFISQVTRI